LRKFALGGYLYAILDATDAPAVPQKAAELGEQQATSLFRGTAKEEDWAIAPYLAHVEAPVLDWLVATLWQAPWGIFIFSKSGFDELYRHFRRFLAVQLPDGQAWLFRFYDPRVLRTFLTTCLPAERQQFAGPVRGFGVTDPDTGDVQIWRAAVAAGEAPPPASSHAGLFRIRTEQFAVFQQEAEESFLTRLVKHLQQHHPDKVAQFSAESLVTAVRHGVRRARAYGMTWESAITAYVALLFAIHPRFDDNPKVRRILGDQTIPANARVDELLKQLTNQDWEQAQQLHMAGGV
jgi:hypothetical protein